VFFRGSVVGTERVVLTRSAGRWQIESTGSLGPPFDLVTTKFQMDYGADWQPQQLLIDGRLRGIAIRLSTTFGITTASNEALQSTERASNTHQISPRSVVLPNGHFAAYEALAARLAPLATGAQLPVYVAPEGEVSATVERVTPRRIVSPEGTLELREFVLTFSGSTGPVPVEVWVDSRQRLARVSLPGSSVVAMRSDLTSVMAREEVIRNPGDESAFVPANGFNLASTITKPTKPAGPKGKVPAVIFVSSPGPQTRDYVAYGIPIFGQLAGKVAEAGYFAVRYDARGVGQTGGRTETAGLTEYADDVLAVVDWLRKRPEVDADRIALVGYGDGGPIAMLAASRQKRVKALALLASPGRSGREVTLEQQQQVLAGLAISESEKAARRTLQSRVNDATVTGRGWEGIPAELRRQAETAWFRSWLAFDPAVTLKKVEPPVLIVHGTIDREVAPEHADRLEELARTVRKRPAAYTRKVLVPDVNHLLASAKSGDVDEYVTLESRTVAPSVMSALIEWLPTAWPAR